MSSEFVPAENYPELLIDLQATVLDALKRNGIAHETAMKVAFEAAERARTRWGGHSLYMPKGELYELTRRDWEIWERFNGHNIAELAEKYGLSEIHIYRVIAKCRAADSKRRQNDMFGE